MHALVAGIGNVFDGDDGFGCAVARRLAEPGAPDLPAGTRVVDYGIRGMHLAYDLLSGVDLLVLVDALPAEAGAAGTVRVLQVDAEHVDAGGLDTHGMHPAAVLAGVKTMGGSLPPTYVVGCPVLDTSERIGLSETIAAAVAPAADAVHRLLRDPAVGNRVRETPARGWGS